MRTKRAGIIGLGLVFLFVVILSSLSAEEKKTEISSDLLEMYLKKSSPSEGALSTLIRPQYSYLRAQEPADEFQEAIQSDSRKIVGGTARVVYFSDDELFKVYMGLDIWATEKIFVLTQAVYDPFLAHHLTLSAQGGIRLGSFSPRIGIIESEFGLGIDFYAFKDKFKLSADVFDFGRDPQPSYMIWAGYSVLNGLQLVLGIDVIVSTEERLFAGFEIGF